MALGGNITPLNIPILDGLWVVGSFDLWGVMLSHCGQNSNLISKGRGGRMGESCCTSRQGLP